jgi:hypothetical protein
MMGVGTVQERRVVEMAEDSGGSDEPEFEGRFARLRKYFIRKPDSSLRTLYADIERMEGYHSFAAIDGYTVEADEPAGLGGTDKAPTPTQILLAALGHCQAITLKIYAEGLGLQLDKVQVKVTGIVDLRGYFSIPDEHGEPLFPGLDEVIIKTNIESKEPRDRILGLIEASKGRGVCLSSVRPTKGIRFSYKHNGVKMG